MDLFMNVAMLRVCMLFMERAVSGFGAQDLKSLALRTHCQTSGWSLTEQDRITTLSAPPLKRGPRRWAVLSHCIPTPLTKRWSAYRFLSTHCPQHPDYHQEESELCRTAGFTGRILLH
ncbi:methylmalonyl-CoA mutase family protein [Escherichia coli]